MYSKSISHACIEDALAYLTNRSFSLGNDLIVLDNIMPGVLARDAIQLNFLVFCYCEEGWSEFCLSGQPCTLKSGNLLISTGNQVLTTAKSSSDFKAKAVLMSRAYAQDSIVGLNYLWPNLLYVLQNPVLMLNKEEEQWVTDCYKLLCKRLARHDHHYLRETVVALTRAFYFDVCNLLVSRNPIKDSAKHNRSYTLFDRFARLSSQHFREERSVEWYAEQLCISPKHLSEVVKSVSGRTAGQWITTMVLIEIKTLLQNTDLSIKEIAMKMNFTNQSFLGKYFKNAEGISPTEFRAKREETALKETAGQAI